MNLQKKTIIFLTLGVIFISVFFIINKYYSFSFIISPNTYPTKNTQQKTKIDPTITVPKPTTQPSKSRYLNPVVSSDGTLYLIHHIEMKLDNSVLTISMRDADGSYRILKQNDVLTSNTSTHLLQETIENTNEHYLTFLSEDYSQPKEYKTTAAINNSNNKIAILLPQEIVILSFTYGEETPTGNENTTIPTLRIRDTKRIPLNLASHDSFYPQVFFSETDNYLYIANRGIENGVWGYRINTENYDYTPLTFKRTVFYPLTNSDGVVYWGGEDTSIVSSVYNEMDFITLDYITFQKSIRVTDNRSQEYIGSYDYGGFITVNPNHEKVCAERGASGYWGYVVGTIDGNELVTDDTGIQYSNCEYWMNNNEVLLYENPYQNQQIERYYIYNTLNQDKSTLILKNRSS